MTDRHPVDSELAAFAEGAVTESVYISEHVATCRSCAEIVSRLSANLEGPPSFTAPPGIDAVPSSALRRLAEAANPQPAPGQLWRAEARPGEILLVWIRRLRSDGRLAVVPVTFDPDYADEYSLVLDAEQSPLGIDLVFHTTVESTIDQRALTNSLGAIEVATEIEAVRTARGGGTRVAGLHVGSPIASMADERVQYRQQLADTLVEMTTARFQPDSSELIDDDFSDVDAQDDSLDELFDDATLAQFLREILNGLSAAHPTARLVPSTRMLVAQGAVRPIGTVLHLDVFVGLVMTSTDVSIAKFLEFSRAMFHTEPVVTSRLLHDGHLPV